MPIYNYIATKDEFLDAKSDFIVNTFERPATNLDWKTALRSAKFSNQLTHRALHAIDNHLYRSTSKELSLITGMQTASPEINAIFLQQMIEKYPNISHVIVEAIHDHEVEFEFVLDLLLDGLKRVAG